MEGIEIDAGIYESAIESLRGKAADRGLAMTGNAQAKILEPSDITDMLKEFRDSELDAHPGVMGQNGLGKTMATFILAKYMGGVTMQDMVYPFNTHSELIEKIAKLKNHNIYVDELNVFFDYLGWNSKEQRALMNTIEVCRENCNIIFGCMRDYSRININYRNGKMNPLIWILDRVKANKEKGVEPYSYGVVLLGNPFIQIEDKFFLSQLPPSYDYRVMRTMIERLPSFIGYIRFDNIDKHVDKDIIKTYRVFKEQGKQYMGSKHIEDLRASETKKQVLRQRYENELNQSTL